MSRHAGRGRRYDLALAAAGSPVPGVPASTQQPDGPGQHSTPPSPARPPPFAPTIRAPARRERGSSSPLDGLVESAADGVLLVTQPDGVTAFDISIRDDVFDELSCRVSVRAGRVTATFRVKDADLRRLLEAEAGRLRGRLSDRGLRVDEIAVVED